MANRKKPQQQRQPAPVAPVAPVVPATPAAPAQPIQPVQPVAAPIAAVAPAVAPAGAPAPMPGEAGKLSPEQIAARKAKRLANKKTQMPFTNLLADVCTRCGQPQVVVAAVVASLKESVGAALLADSVVMLGPDLGSFKVMITEPRKARNPRTGESIDVPAGKRVKFQVGSSLKTLLLTGQAPMKTARKQPAQPVVGAPVGPGVAPPPTSIGAPVPGIGGQSERAKKIAARRATKAAEGVVDVSVGPTPSVPGTIPVSEPASSNPVLDKDIDDILNESMGIPGEEVDIF